MPINALIIAYYWEPAGGPGVQRWVKFTKYFENYGIKPTVFVPENPSYPIVDSSIKAEIPNTVKVLKFPISEPYKWAKVLSKTKTKQISSGIVASKKASLLEKILLGIRGNFFIPDARVGWVKPSVSFLETYIMNNSIDVIITTGPPHSLHIIGMQLKEKLNLPWIADFRDPWTTIHYHKLLKLGKSAKKKHIWLEKKVLQSADCIVVTSPSTQKEFELKTNVPIQVITNGFDIEKTTSEVSIDTRFSLVHIGSLLSERNPVILWEVLSEIINENKEFSKNLTIRLVGAVSPEIIKTITKKGLKPYLEITGYVSHKEAIRLQQQAQLLLLIESNREETSAIIPGKLFEYLHAQRPIVAILPKNSDVAAIIDQTQSGNSFLYSEKERLKKQIKSYYKAFKNGDLQIQSKNIQQYSRKSLTQKMGTLIKDVIKTKTPN